MSENDKSVFERLDSIESQQTEAQSQSKEILELLKNLDQKVENANHQNIVVASQSTDKQRLNDFLKNSKKEYIWLGKEDKFHHSKFKTIISFILFSICSIIATIITSFAVGLYSTFTFIENVWLITGLIMFFKTTSLTKTISDSGLKASSTSIFKMDSYGMWRNTQAERKLFRWTRRLSYLGVILNLIWIFINFQGLLSIFAASFEILTFIFTIIFWHQHLNLFMNYDFLVIFTGKKETPEDKPVVLVGNIPVNKLMTLDECRKHFQNYGNIF